MPDITLPIDDQYNWGETLRTALSLLATQAEVEYFTVNGALIEPTTRANLYVFSGETTLRSQVVLDREGLFLLVNQSDSLIQATKYLEDETTSSIELGLDDWAIVVVTETEVTRLALPEKKATITETGTGFSLLVDGELSQLKAASGVALLRADDGTVTIRTDLSRISDSEVRTLMARMQKMRDREGC